MVASLYCVYATHVERLNFVMEAILPPYSSVEKAPAAAAKEKGANPGWTIIEDDFTGGLEAAKKEGKLALLNWTGIT